MKHNPQHPFTFFQRWLQLPGNEIWANLDMQKNLPGMNARTYNAGPPVPESSYAPTSPVGGAEEVRAPQAMPEGLPPTFERQWRSPLVQQREQNPAVPIMPWPTLTVTVSASAANVVRAITIPEGAVLFTVTYPAVTTAVFVCNTRFELPFTNTTTDVDDTLSATVGPMVNPPPGIWWNCEGMRQLFVGTAGGTVPMSISFWTGYQPRVPAISPMISNNGPQKSSNGR